MWNEPVTASSRDAETQACAAAALEGREWRIQEKWGAQGGSRISKCPQIGRRGVRARQAGIPRPCASRPGPRVGVASHRHERPADMHQALVGLACCHKQWISLIAWDMAIDARIMTPMRCDLPSGTVTFVFTDIEGSTRLLRELGGEGYAEALGEHRRVLRGAFYARGGVEVDTQGDAFFFVFNSAAGAVTAAEVAQRALASGSIRVRMGVHTGRPFLSETGYVGEDVHLGARVAASGHGGQVLLSQATRELVDVDVLDLGEHRLKDFAAPVWIYQLGRVRFPPLKTISNTNLPHPASSFIGRSARWPRSSRCCETAPGW